MKNHLQNLKSLHRVSFTYASCYSCQRRVDPIVAHRRWGELVCDRCKKPEVSKV